MRPQRALVLRRETLTELTADELRVVVGAEAISGNTCPPLECVSGLGTCIDVTRSCW